MNGQLASTNFGQEGDAPLTPCPPVLKVFACQLLRELSLSLVLHNSDFQFFRKNLHGSYKTVSLAPDVLFGQFLDLAWGS